MADLRPFYHGSEQLRIIDTHLYLLFALLQACTGGHLGKNKTVFHKSILRDFSPNSGTVCVQLKRN